MGHASGRQPGDRSHQGSERALIIPPLLAMVVMAVAYSYIIPLGYGPDEPRHFNLIKLLWADRMLPRVLPDGRELGNAIALHPPTYYLIEGVLWYPAQWLGRAMAPHLAGGFLRRLIVGAEPARVPQKLLARAVAYRVFRLTSPLWGIATLLLVFRAVRATWPSAPYLAAAVAWALALWPHLLMNFATITNDCGANLAGAVFVWYWACRAPKVRGRLREAAEAGLVLALSALMKVQVAACLTPVAAVALAWPHGRRFWRQAIFWQRLAVASAVMAALAGPWYARNFALYGTINYVPRGYSIIPPGMSLVDAVAAGIVGSALLAAIGGLFRSIWTQVGWLPAAVAPALYAVLAVFVAGAVAGVVRLRGRSAQWLRLGTGGLRAAACFFLPFAAAWLLAVYAAVFVHFGWHEGGRYLLFALPGFAGFLAVGWGGLAGPKRALYIMVALLTVLNVASAYNLVSYLNPTFGTTVLIGQ